jgi:hypothetical protein
MATNPQSSKALALANSRLTTCELLRISFANRRPTGFFWIPVVFCAPPLLFYDSSSERQVDRRTSAELAESTTRWFGNLNLELSE